MDQQFYKSEEDLARELAERQRLLKKKADGDYISYPAGEEGRFIHEYAGGRRILVEIDATGKEHFLKEL